MTFAPEINGREQLPDLSLGDAELERNSYWSQVYERTQSQWVTWVCYALIASAGLFFMALYWFDRTQRYILWISLTWLDLADLRINEFLVSASVNYSSHLEFLLYALGQSLPIFVILFFFAVNRKPVPIFFRLVLGINFFYPTVLFVAALLPLRAGVALRWFIEVQPTMTTIEVRAPRTDCACHRVLRLDADGLCLYGCAVPLPESRYRAHVPQDSAVPFHGHRCRRGFHDHPARASVAHH
jgi:hypothetical protein